MKSSLKISILLICSLTVSIVTPLPSRGQYTPKATLYSETGGSGSFLNLPTNQHVTSLQEYGFNNRAQSICLVGTWIVYDGENFNGAGDAAVEYIFEPKYHCVNFKQIGGYVSSAKFVGSAVDYRSSSITFYSETFFQQEEEFASLDLPNLRLTGRTASIIVTGSSSWTIYDKPNYTGKGICLQVTPTPDFAPSFVSDTADLTPTVPHGSIASVRKGCYTRNVIRVEPFPSIAGIKAHSLQSPIL